MNNTETRVKHRIDWIDTAKGIGMLLVILGHTVRSDGGLLARLIRGSIFSFHMPLFFILSSLTFRMSMDKEQYAKNTKRAGVHLIIPALVIFFLRTFIDIAQNFGTIEWTEYIAKKMLQLGFCSGTKVTIGDAVVIPAFGMMWFFVVLFVSRSIFDYLHLRLEKGIFNALICVMSVIGVVIGRVQCLPLSFDIAMAVLPLFLFGIKIRETDIFAKPFSLLAAAVAVWGVSFATIYYFSHDYLELASRRYPLFPICFVTAIAGTIAVSCLSKVISGFVFIKPITYVGKYSLWFFSVHAMDYLYKPIWQIADNNVVNGIIRIVIDFFVTLVLLQIVYVIKDMKQKD